jgi:hypothetical protein
MVACVWLGAHSNPISFLPTIHLLGALGGLVSRRIYAGGAVYFLHSGFGAFHWNLTGIIISQFSLHSIHL